MRIGAGTVSGLYIGTTAATAAYLGTTQVFGGSAPPLDADALAYITAVEAADAQTLETGVKAAINNFVVGCKADGIWAAIKASCILAGARTLSGALTPLRGAAPTNFNFVSADYNRKTGLVGNGSTKYLNSNRANNAEPQNNFSVGVFIHTLHGGIGAFGAYAGAGGIGNGAVNLVRGFSSTDTNHGFRSRSTTLNLATSASTGMLATARSLASSYVARTNGANTTFSVTSQIPTSGNIYIYSREDGGSALAHANARIQYYWIGESLDLDLLDARVSALMVAIDGAIP